MDFLDDVLSQLSALAVSGYHQRGETATEPAALTAIALLAHGQSSAAQRWIDWLLARQEPQGDLGVDAAQATPYWPTGWCVLAWQLAQEQGAGDRRLQPAIDRGVQAIFRSHAMTVDHVERMGHDPSIPGWAWVDGTHSWVEPTAMNVLALRHTGYADHPRARDGLRLLANRLMERGGANYGNTTVMEQELRPHIQPTGLALLALAGQPDSSGRLALSADYLLRELDDRTATASLCYALLGLAAQDCWPKHADVLLDAAAARTLARDPAAYPLALLTLASLGDACPLLPSPLGRVAQ